ncbi:hypothetical protein BDZ45DRAFT_599619, partial [Acephala macrosclerotiorum]
LHASAPLTWERFELPDSRLVHGETLPLGLRLSIPEREQTIDEIGQLIKDLSGKGVLRELLSKHGAILFRGLPIKDSQEFTRFVNSAQSKYFLRPHEDVGLSGKQTTVTSNVKTANKEHLHVKFYFYNEYGRSTYFPGILYFFSEKVPDQGGQTRLLSSLELYDRLKLELPQFIDDLTTKGAVLR